MHELFNTFNSFIIDIDMQMPGKLLSHNDFFFYICNSSSSLIISIIITGSSSSSSTAFALLFLALTSCICIPSTKSQAISIASLWSSLCLKLIQEHSDEEENKK